MAGIDVVAIPAAASYTTFDDLRLGRSSQQVVGRLLRFWDARNIKKDGEFMGIVLLLLDEKNSVIHAFIPADRADNYRTSLKEGAIFNLREFEVAKCTNLYKITDHPFVIRVIPSTTIVELGDCAATIKQEKFMLRSSNHLHALANTNLELPDVVGQICFVQGSNLEDATNTQRLVVRLRVETSVIVYLSLWDDAAATFRSYLCSPEPMKAAMVVTTVNPKLFGGNLYLNSTAATRFFFDPTIHAIQQLTKSLGIEAGEPFKRAETMADMRKKEKVSIAELYDFVSKTNEQTQEADFICKAQTIVGVLKRNGWSYVSCTGCSRKLEKRGTSFRCNRCVSPNVVGTVRYRVELAVHDGNDEATFVVFDSEMTKLINKTAASLIVEVGDGRESNEIPTTILALTGKHFIFQIRVTPFNFTPKHRTFIVSTIIEDIPAGDDTQGGSVDSGPHFRSNMVAGSPSTTGLNEATENATRLNATTSAPTTGDEKSLKRKCV